MAKNNKADMSCARVKKYTASDVSKAERHNERKNETYENMNVIEERIPFNVHFKKPFAPTYMEQLKQMETNGLVSLRGLRKDATLFNEIVIDVNTMYFERNGGYEYHLPPKATGNISPVPTRPGPAAAMPTTNCCANSRQTATAPLPCAAQQLQRTASRVQAGWSAIRRTLPPMPRRISACTARRRN